MSGCYYLEMDKILSSVEKVAERSKQVSINTDALEAFGDSLSIEELESEHTLFEGDDELSLDDAIAFGYVYNAVNFSYWGEPKWTYAVGGEDKGGGIGMLHAILHGIHSGRDLLSSDYLGDMSPQDIKELLQANVEIPLLEERLKMLRTLGQHISSRYGGSFTAFVEQADWDAVKIVEKLADEMPDVFNDEENYEGLKVKFYKRAQLVPSHLHELWLLGISNRDVTNLDEMTALADYKVPQVLRKYGILQYSPGLSRKVDSKVELASGSEEEVEIRAMTVWAVELLGQHLRKRGMQVNSLQLDHAMWLRGRQKSSNDKPYHRTRTIWY